jgi:hypothetical protein
MSNIQKKPFVPPQFTSFGKLPKDLFKKKFEFEHTLKVQSANRSGLKLESGAILANSGELKGYVKSTFPRFSFGSVSAELYTDASSDSKVTLALTGLPKGLTISPSISAKDKSFGAAMAGVDVNYSQEYFATSVTAKSDLEKHLVDASISLGEGGVSVGGNIALDVSSGADIKSMNYGVDYQQDDYTASIYTENNMQSVTAAYFQRLNVDHVLGAQFKYAVGGGARAMTIGSEYRVNPNTTVKTKIDVPSGDVAAHVEHRLANPSILVGVATAFNVRSQKIAADKIGLNFALGDF